MTNLADIARALDGLLRTAGVPDYPNALNGVQLAHRGPIRGIAAAVDLSLRTIDGAIAAKANVLMVHHGLFWGGLQPIVGAFHERIRRLIENDIAVYASHLPLDLHPDHGNNGLLARALGLTATRGFARFRDVFVGLAGDSDELTSDLIRRVRAISDADQTLLRTTALPADHRTRRWGICTGAGASADTIREAIDAGIDTLIVGEGPHWTAVDAPDHGIAIIYAGHYATETFGIKSIAEWVSRQFGIPWTFVEAPTGF